MVKAESADAPGKMATSLSRKQPTSVREVLAWLERRGTKRNREGMARYGIHATKVFGVSMATIQPLAKRLGAITSSPLPCGRPVGTRPAS